MSSRAADLLIEDISQLTPISVPFHFPPPLTVCTLEIRKRDFFSI